MLKTNTFLCIHVHIYIYTDDICRKPSTHGIYSVDSICSIIYTYSTYSILYYIVYTYICLHIIHVICSTFSIYSKNTMYRLHSIYNISTHTQNMILVRLRHVCPSCLCCGLYLFVRFNIKIC